MSEKDRIRLLATLFAKAHGAIEADDADEWHRVSAGVAAVVSALARGMDSDPKGAPRGLHEAMTLDMTEPWFRDIMISRLASYTDLGAWSLRMAEHYSKSGTLEISACILALRSAAGLVPLPDRMVPQ